MSKRILRNNQQGFTLIELMITLVIMGIIAAIAFPSFQSTARESRRGEAKTQLLQLHMQQERYRMENTTYAAAADLTLPASTLYTFTVESTSATTFTLKATAKGDQANDTGCTVLTLDQSMTKTPAACW